MCVSKVIDASKEISRIKSLSCNVTELEQYKFHAIAEEVGVSAARLLRGLVLTFLEEYGYRL